MSKGKKTNFWNFFQMLGKTFMFPIALLSISGMMLGIGAGFTDPNMIEMIPFLGNKYVNLFLQLMTSLGLFAFSNLGALFAMAIPLGLLKKEKEIGAFSALVGFIAMHLGTNFYLNQAGLLVPAKEMAINGQAMIMGIQSYNTSVLGGIITGLIIYAIHDKVTKFKMPESLGFYSGARLVPIVSLLLMGAVGLIVPIVWPPVLHGFQTVGSWISSSGPVGYFAYAAAERITIPFGLNHLVTSTFRFTPIGGSALIGGQEYFGTLNMFMAYVENNQIIPLDLAGKMEQGKLMIQYGLAGAALAIYRTAKPEKRKAIKGLLISGVLTVIIGGISEPIEFLFLFISPALFAFHTVMNGLGNMILPYIGVHMGFTGDLIQFLTFGVLRGTETGWPMAVAVAALYFVIYYFVFKWAIVKFNIKTPGREDEDIEIGNNGGSDFNGLSTYKGQQMIAALGGRDNIVSLDNCVTRLRLGLKDVSKINESAIKQAGGIAVVKLDNNAIQVIVGTKVYALRKQMDKVLDGAIEEPVMA